MADETDDGIRAVHDLLGRASYIAALPTLLAAARGPADEPEADAVIAFGFDTNALYELTAERSSDVVDFVTGVHPGPVVVPGQVIQEFWKNKISAIQTQSATIKRRYDELAAEVKKLATGFEPFDARFADLLAAFSAEYGHAFDPATAARISNALAALQGRAIVPYVPRERFLLIAEVREKTRTPPGFHDRGHGDFFVWADYLLGLLRARSETAIDYAIFVTDDAKPDWSREGVAHPVLTAEVEALLGVKFSIWGVNRLRGYVNAKLSSSAAGHAEVAPPAQTS
jgi:hypothetical protein